MEEDDVEEQKQDEEEEEIEEDEEEDEPAHEHAQRVGQGERDEGAHAGLLVVLLQEGEREGEVGRHRGDDVRGGVADAVEHAAVADAFGLEQQVVQRGAHGLAVQLAGEVDIDAVFASARYLKHDESLSVLRVAAISSDHSRCEGIEPKKQAKRGRFH